VELVPLVGLLLAATIYVVGVVRLGRRGVAWSARRSACWAGGLAVLVIALAPPLAAHDEDVRVHVLQHLLLGMLAPLLLSLGAPITLLLRSLPPRRRPAVARLLHARPARVLGHPLVAAALATAPLYGLYFTPLYRATLHSHLLHDVVHLHMLLTGYLLAWALVGLDPSPHRPAPAVRSVALVGALTGHAVLAKLLYANAPSLATADASAADWRQASLLLWYGGDAVDLLLLIAFFAQWYAAAGRRWARVAGPSKRIDTGADSLTG
jgi:putative membrane protein